MHTHQMISTHPQVQGNTNEILIRCIEACFDCEQACISCADACLGEPMLPQLIQCIRLNLDCADVCRATGAMSTRRTGSDVAILKSMLDVCSLACRVCGDECERHAQQHPHCAICAQACRECEQLCRAATQSIPEAS